MCMSNTILIICSCVCFVSWLKYVFVLFVRTVSNLRVRLNVIGHFKKGKSTVSKGVQKFATKGTSKSEFFSDQRKFIPMIVTTCTSTCNIGRLTKYYFKVLFLFCEFSTLEFKLTFFLYYLLLL